jgi:hypothetical protein
MLPAPTASLGAETPAGGPVEAPPEFTAAAAGTVVRPQRHLSRRSGRAACLHAGSPGSSAVRYSCSFEAVRLMPEERERAWLRWSVRNAEEDLAELRAGLEPLVRGPGLGEW